jgi:hypothetical protein
MEDLEMTKAIARAAAMEVDLEVAKELSGVREEVAGVRGEIRALKASLSGMIAKEIKDCQAHQEKRRSRKLGTWLTIIGLVAANGIALWAMFGG